MDEESAYPPRVLSEEEIEMYLKGERKEVDRLILYSLNRLASSLVPHVKSEADFMKRVEELGGVQVITARAAYVDSLIRKNAVRSAMMEKVSQSTLTWAFLAFCGFLALSVWHELIAAINLKLGG